MEIQTDIDKIYNLFVNTSYTQCHLFYFPLLYLEEFWKTLKRGIVQYLQLALPNDLNQDFMELL